MSLLVRRNPRLAIGLGMGAGIVASLWGIVISLFDLVTQQSFAIKASFMFPFADLSLRIDPLSAFFILLINLVVLPISIYSLGYLKEYQSQGHNLGGFGFLYHGFILSMILVVSANHVVSFLIAWEAMAVFSYFLVMYEGKENSQCLNAGFFYLIITHLGTALILVAFLLMFKATGALDFDSFRDQGHAFADGLKTLLFFLMFIGFGAKAGVLPLHGWLPEAHPVAPSNISALMSAVMLKTAIYGMLRVFFDFLGPGPWWWGGIVLAVGAVTALMGVLYALMEKDIKRLLAYSSIENIGIIVLGVGLALIFHSYSLSALTLLTLVALLYHALNHAVFKSLLFAGAGAILFAVHSKNMDDLGGLVRAMPAVSAFFLVGALSMAAMPPFNGFVSEWLLFQSLLQGGHIPSTLSKVAIPLAGAALALTAALAAVVSVKLFGITFLGMARSAKVAHAREVPLAMKAGLGILVLGCLGLGVGATGAIYLLERTAFYLAPKTATVSLTSGWATLAIPPSFSSLSMVVLFIALIFAAGLPYLLLRRKKPSREQGPTWDCGIPELKPRMEYTETAYVKPFRIIFEKVLMPVREFEKKYYFPYFPKKMSYRGSIGILSVFNNYLYQPVVDTILRVANKVRLLHGGSINVYLAYIFVTLILILMFQNIKG